jgi:hypothetical protein
VWLDDLFHPSLRAILLDEQFGALDGLSDAQDFQDQEVLQGAGSSLIQRFGTIQVSVQPCGSATNLQRT